MNQGRRAAGFTLLEVLLSVIILSMIAAIALPVYESSVRRSDLDNTTTIVAALIRRAENYAQTMSGDSGWSVEFQSSTVTLFKGASFAGRTTSYDEAYTVPGSVTVSGLSEVQFTQQTATPNTTGSVTLTSTTNDTRTISINAKGTVDF